MHHRLPAVLLAVALATAACTGGRGDRDDLAQPAAPTAPSPTVPSPSVASPSVPSPTPGDDASPAPTVEPSPEPTPVAPVDGPFAAELLPDRDGPVRFTVALSDPATPAALAAQVVSSEEAVRDPTLSDDTHAVAAHRTQRAYRQLGREDAWRDEVLTALPDRWRAVAEGNLAARDALDRLLAEGERPTALPAWEVVAPAPADELLQHYRDAEAALGVDWELLAAINLVETRMGRIVGLSTAGARGPMQFIPASWAAFGAGGDIDDPRDSIFAAARHLTRRPGSPPTERGALFNYNNSVHYVDAVQAYAGVLRADPDAYRAHHGWQVYYATPQGEFLLPVGYREEEPVPVDDYLARPALDVVG